MKFSLFCLFTKIFKMKINITKTPKEQNVLVISVLSSKNWKNTREQYLESFENPLQISFEY